MNRTAALTVFIRLTTLDDLERVDERGFLPLLLHQELHQVLGAHEASAFGVLSVDHIDFLPMGEQVVEMLDLFPRQEPGLGFVTFLFEESIW